MKQLMLNWFKDKKLSLRLPKRSKEHLYIWTQFLHEFKKLYFTSSTTEPHGNIILKFNLQSISPCSDCKGTGNNVKPRWLEDPWDFCLANRQLHQQKEAENGCVFCQPLLFPPCYLHWWILFPSQLMLTQQKGYQQAHLTKQWNLELVLWVTAFRYFPVTMAQIFWLSFILVSFISFYSKNGCSDILLNFHKLPEQSHCLYSPYS